MEKTRKTRKNPVYSLFQKIPSFGKLVLVLAMLFANIPLYRFYSAAGTVLPQLVTNFVFVLYIALFINVLYYAVLTSYIVQKSDETKSHSCTVVSAGSAVSVIVLSIGITLFGTFVQQNDLDTLLRHSDSPNENYTVEVRGSRKGPYSGYDADVYLIDNKTNTREYINALTDEQHIYIKWTSETEFYIGMTDYMITDKGVTYQRHQNLNKKGSLHTHADCLLFTKNYLLNGFSDG